MLHEIFAYCPETGDLIWRVDRVTGFGGTISKAGDVAGCKDGRGYVVVKTGGKRYYAHRVAWLLHYGEEAPQHIDHINGDKSDNRLCNLRAATPSQNRCNVRSAAKPASGFKGVVRHYNRFASYIRVQGEKKYLGVFDTPEQAHAAYAAAAEKYHGEFACVS